MNRLIHLYQTNQRVREFVRFCVVGGIATLIDMAIFYSLRPFVHYNVALICGYCLSLAFNYYLTVRWTFQTQSSARNLFGVVAAHMINLFIVRMGLMHIFIHFLSLPSALAYFPTLLLSVLINFLLVRALVK